MALSSPEAARRAAEAVLSEGRFHGSAAPHPLRGVLESVGQVLSDPIRAAEHLANTLGNQVTGGVAGVWAAGAAVLLVSVGMLAARHARTRLGRALEPAAVPGPARPAQLEREASLAERAGRWDDAVRLRFRAGVIRLGERRELGPTDSMPNHVIGRMVRSSRFEALASRFDEVAYGGREATALDAEHQRHDWPAVLAEGGHDDDGA